MKKHLIFLIVFIPYFIFSQNRIQEFTNLKGIWEGSFEENNEKYKVIVKIDKSEPIFVFTNFKNDKFTVLEGKISKNKDEEIEVEIKKATLSYCEKCNFIYGKIKITRKKENQITVSINGVGPSYWRTYDVEEGMTDINNLELTKTESKK